MPLDFSDLGASQATPPPPPQSGGGGGALNFSDLGAVPARDASPAPAPTQPNQTPNPGGSFHDYAMNADLPNIPVLQQAGEVGRGILKEGLGAVGGLLNILAKNRESGLADQQQHAQSFLKQLGEAGDPAVAEVARRAQPGRTPDTDPIVRHTRDAANWLNQGTELHGFWEHLGGFGENIGELLSGESLARLAKPTELAQAAEAGDGAAKIATAADKYADAAKVSKVLDQYPKIRSLVTIGLSTLKKATEAGAQGAAQTYVHSGGDGEQTAIAGGIGAVTGGVVHAAPQAARAVLERLAKPSETVEGVENAAKGIVGEHLDKTNAIRGPQPTTAHPDGDYTFEIGGTPTQERVDGQIAFDPRKKQIGTKVYSGKGPSETKVWPDGATGEPQSVTVHSGDTEAPGSHRAPTYQMLPEPKPGSGPVAEDRASGGATLRTTDPRVMGNHLSNLSRIVGSPEFAEMEPEQQQAYRAIRDDAQKQWNGYLDQQRATGKIRSALQPIDVNKAVRETGSFGDAYQQLHKSAIPVYDILDEVSMERHGNTWRADKDNLEAAQESLSKMSSGTQDAERAAKMREISILQQKMDDTVRDPRTKLSQQEASQAIRNFRTGYVLKEADRRISSLYDQIANRSAHSNTMEGVGSSRLGKIWSDFLNDPNYRDARQIIGSDRADALQKIFDMNETRASRRQLGNSIARIAMHLVPGGGLAHAAGDAALRKVMGGLVSNPAAAKSLMFAIESGAKPENYAPGIAKMIGRTLIPATASNIARAGSSPN